MKGRVKEKGFPQSKLPPPGGFRQPLNSISEIPGYQDLKENNSPLDFH
jgi:hypothetical protein